MKVQVKVEKRPPSPAPTPQLLRQIVFFQKFSTFSFLGLTILILVPRGAFEARETLTTEKVDIGKFGNKSQSFKVA